MPNARRVSFAVWTGLLFIFLGGAAAEAQAPASTGPASQAAAVDLRNLQIGALYLLSAETYVVFEPEPELHTVPGVSLHPEHMEQPPLVPASTVVRIARRSASEGVMWYELRSQDGETSFGWASADELSFQELTRVE